MAVYCMLCATTIVSDRQSELAQLPPEAPTPTKHSNRKAMPRLDLRDAVVDPILHTVCSTAVSHSICRRAAPKLATSHCIDSLLSTCANVDATIGSPEQPESSRCTDTVFRYAG